MAKRYINPNLTLLLNCTSTDETRYHLTAIHYTGAEFVATDGHRMVVVRAEAIAHNVSQVKPGTTYERDAFALDVLKPLECKYPNWKQLLPDTKQSKHAFKMVIPRWVSLFKPKSKSFEAFGIDENGQFTTGKALVYLNMEYLRELADVEVWVYIKDANSPIVIQPVPLNKNTSIDWTLVVMPMRAIARPVTAAVISTEVAI